MQNLRFLLLLIIISFSSIIASGCKNIFSALSEPVTDSYYQIFLPQTGQITSYHAGDDGAYQKGAVWPSPRFIDNGNGTITDRLTGLMWEKAPVANQVSWVNTFTRIATLNNGKLGGYSDWRMPNRKEILSLINFGESDPKNWLSSQGFSLAGLTFLWSSNTFIRTPANNWRLNTGLSSALLSVDSGASTYVLAVRGGR